MKQMLKQQRGFPGIVISGLRGGSGKTIISIGIISALTGQGKSIAPFKKGPDYIDAGWLALAAGHPCYNLDTFLIDQNQILKSFYSHTSNNQIAVIEGNRGLYDCIDTSGATSTAELAKLINAPVILCVDCTKATRTIAALVCGCLMFDPGLSIKGVILNRIAGPRHENILRKSIEQHCNVKVLGAVPKLKKDNFPERHMGLVPTHEHEWANQSVQAASDMANRYLDLNAITNLATQHTQLTTSSPPAITTRKTVSRVQNGIRIGIIKDSAFQFYYPENIEAIQAAGAELIYISPLTETSLPRIHALYIGGGFPETHANELSRNQEFRNQIKSLAQKGLPVYAECGGLMYLGKELVLDSKSYPMAGVLPVVFGFSRKPQGHGYTICFVDRENPYFDVGTTFRGHEFHYSKVLESHATNQDTVFSMKRGAGFQNGRDGLCYKNVLATYTHIHALSIPSWAKALVRNAKTWQKLMK